MILFAGSDIIKKVYLYHIIQFVPAIGLSRSYIRTIYLKQLDVQSIIKHRTQNTEHGTRNTEHESVIYEAAQACTIAG
jgi:hypothetical protein